MSYLVASRDRFVCSPLSSFARGLPSSEFYSACGDLGDLKLLIYGEKKIRVNTLL